MYTRYIIFSISATQLSTLEISNPNQVELDVKCLQILRALVHNEERRLPENWADEMEKNKMYV